MAFIKDWDETVPAGTRNISLGDDDIRNFKYAIRERLAIDHKFLASETGVSTIGYHSQCTFIEAADIGTGAAGLPIAGAQTSNGKPELCYTDEDDDDVIITRDGYIDLDNGRVQNDTYIKARNAAGNGDVNLIKADSSDVPTLPDGAAMATSAAPTTDPMIANKKYADDTIASNKKVFQVVNTQTGATASGTTQIPLDDTIPQITEGDEYFTRTITPTNASNILIIEVIVNASGDGDWTVALFQDATANALDAVHGHSGSTQRNQTVSLRYCMVAGTTSETTFRVRCGSSTAVTFNLNYHGTARLYGGVNISSITITEVAA